MCLKKCCVRRQCKFITPHTSDEKHNVIQTHTTEPLASIENKIENLHKLKGLYVCMHIINLFSLWNKGFLATKQEKFSLLKDKIMKVFSYKSVK